MSVLKKYSTYMSEKKGVETDCCSQCRGVWLDRGEIDKILERASNEYGFKQDGYNNDQDINNGKHYRKRSLLHKLFD